MNIQLPYFDRILTLMEDDAEVEQVFGEHVHWGYWEDPARADGSAADFAAAAARLSRRVIAAGGVGDGQRVLDVGCGFGGTLAELGRFLPALELVGLNIDPRQLAHARRRLALNIDLVCGDACRLPFADASFDAVLCVEAIFHFRSRADFFAEAKRVLRPGGRLTLCDFVPRFVIPFLWDYFDKRFKPVVTRLYGPSDMRCTLGDYRRLARAAGMQLVRKEDITPHTLPTYRVLRPLVKRIAPDPAGADRVMSRVEFTTRIGLLRYLILSFGRP